MTKKVSQRLGMVLFWLLLLSGPTLIYAVSPVLVITTVAGDGTPCEPTTTLCGDNGLATTAQLKNPASVVLDGMRNLYIADQFSHRIRKIISPTGVITTVAGNGTACTNSTTPCGDNGPAVVAQLSRPTGVAVDEAGNLYIADQFNHRVRKVISPSGVITTVAGNGTACGNPTTLCGDNGPAMVAQLNFPTGLALDRAGNLFIADQGDHRVRKVISPSGVITTVAGSGAACANSLTPCGDNGPATMAQLNQPTGIVLGSAGDLYIADIVNHRIRKVISATGTITTVAGTGEAMFGGDNGPATAAQLNEPFGIALDGAGDLYIADSKNHRVRKVISATGIIITVAGTGTEGYNGDNGPAASTQLNHPFGVTVVGAGNFYIADWGNNRLRRAGELFTITTYLPVTIKDTSF